MSKSKVDSWVKRRDVARLEHEKKTGERVVFSSVGTFAPGCTLTQKERQEEVARVEHMFLTMPRWKKALARFRGWWEINVKDRVSCELQRVKNKKFFEELLKK